MTLFNKTSLQPGFSMVGPLTFSPPLSRQTDADWMLLAFLEALRGAGSTNPNPAVGCVIVDAEGREISRGFTQPYRDIHAERHAFQQMTAVGKSLAGVHDSADDRGNDRHNDRVKDQIYDRLVGATAYVTLEPCSHQGHQPPCVDLFFRIRNFARGNRYSGCKRPGERNGNSKINCRR